MRIALIGPPFIEIPPRRYGGTELFIGNLARELCRRGEDVVVYGNGDSSLPCPVKWRYPHGDWPLRLPGACATEERGSHRVGHPRRARIRRRHSSQRRRRAAVHACSPTCRSVLTIHHPHEPELSEQYLRYPETHYVAIARWLRRVGADAARRTSCITAFPLADYTLSDEKDDYVAFLGRMAPCKGAAPGHRGGAARGRPAEARRRDPAVFQRLLGAAGARRCIDGDQIEYVGEADFAAKNELLSRARALLFPIQWEEPFGLVMIEAMACGTPVLAFAGGAVEEIVRRRRQRLDLPATSTRWRGGSRRPDRRGVLVPDVRRRALFGRDDGGAIPRRLSTRAAGVSDPAAADWRPEWKT